MIVKDKEIFYERTQKPTHTFATRLNCSNRFLGTKVIMVYFEVMT